MRALDPIRPGAIRARELGRRFELLSEESRSLKQVLLRRELPRRRELWALRHVSLDVASGETVGIVGQNGSGKSTLLKLLAGIFAPTEGALQIGGRVGCLLELGAGFHPEFSGVENVYLNAAIYGLNRSYVDEHLDEILAFAELEEFAHTPVKTYSSGMYTRLGFSVAVHVNPDILLIDEVLAVGDEAFQQKCYGKIWDFKRSGGTLVFVSHDPGAVERLCDRAILLEHGTVVEEGSADDVLRTYHRRLAAREAGTAEPVDAAAEAPCRIVDVRAVSTDGSARQTYVEGEPVTLEAELFSEDEFPGTRATIRVREASGQVIGSQTFEDFDVSAAHTTLVRLHFDSLPLREGRFFVDVRVESHDGDAVLAERDRALELSVFSHDPRAGGPVRLGGTWEAPRAESAAIREAAER